VIANTALDESKSCALCTTTLDMFVSILGSESGNMALNLLATGGVYLGGGIPRRILPVLEKNIFMTAFKSKGRLSYLLERIPVYVIINPKAALLGAACHGLENY
jgi:glucokinase